MRFTKSKDGVIRATMHVPFRVEQALIEWLGARHRLGTTGRAADFVRGELQKKGHEILDWYRFCWNPTKKRAFTVHVDDGLDAGVEVYTPE